MIIDDREDETWKYHDWGFPTREQRMDVGDYLIGNSIIVERKEINDFISSIQQRLWEQANDLEKAIGNENNSIDTALVLIHGSITNLNRHNMEPRKIEAYYGAQARLIASYGVSVATFREASQAMKLMKRLHDKGGDEINKKKPHLTKRSFRDNRVNVLYGIDGIGYETALSLLEEFPSVSHVATASVNQLQNVDGVGPKTAESIYEAFHTED